MHKLKNGVGRDERISKRPTDRPNERTNVRPNRMKFTEDWGSRCVALFGVVLSVGWKSNYVKKRTWAQQIEPINEKFQGVFLEVVRCWKISSAESVKEKQVLCEHSVYFVQSWNGFTSKRSNARSDGETKESRIDAFHRTMTVNQRNWSQT